MRTVLLARHGQTLANLNPSEICGRSNHVPLSAHGRVQSASLGRYLGSSEMPAIDRWVSSTAIRAVDTGKIALETAGIELELTEDGRLQEVSQGQHEGSIRAEVYTPEVLARVAREKMDFKLDDSAESKNEGIQRILGFLKKIRETTPDDSTTLATTHALITRCVVGHLEGWPYEKIVDTSLTPNCSITALTDTGVNGAWQVQYIGKNVLEATS